MKIFVKFCDTSMIDTYYKQNGMYQTTIKYMKMLKESGKFSNFYWQSSTSHTTEQNARIILFHQKDMNDTDYEISKRYHLFNNDFARFPYDSDKDIALAVADESRSGEVSFIFHENDTGIYDEIRYVGEDVNLENGYSVLDEI